MLSARRRLYLVIFTVAALAIGAAWWWSARSPSAAVIARLASIDLPADAAVTTFIRLDSGVDAAFIAELELPSLDGAAVCQQQGLVSGVAEHLPQEVRARLPKPWYSNSLCYKRHQTQSQWEFVVVSKDAVVVHIRSQ